MFRLLRYFSIASAVALIAVLIALVYLYRDHAMEHLVDMAEGQNISLARSLANNLWPRFSHYTMTVPETDGDKLRARPETAEIDEAVRTLTAGLPVLKVKIYNLDGRTIYSSQPSQIGADKSNNRGFLRSALAGKPESKFSVRENFSALSGEVFNRSLVESYLPIWGDDDAIEGVFELYTDVTSMAAEINQDTDRLTVGLLITFALLYGVLFVIVRRADRILKRQYAHQLEYREQVEVKNTSLEREIDERKRVEEALERLTRQNELILNSAGEGIYGLDLAGHTTFINPAAAKMIGWGLEELIGKAPHAILHHTKPDGSPYPREECPIYAAFRDGAVHHVDDEVFWRKDGTSFPVEYVSTPIRDDNGKLTGAVVIFRDITNRKAAEEALRESEEQFRNLIQGSIQGVLIHREGKPLFANQALADIFGYDGPEEILALPSVGMLKAKRERERLAIYSEERMQHGSAPVRYEFEGVQKDRTHIWLENFVTLVVWNGESAIQSTSVDITERKHLQQELDLRLAQVEMAQMAYERQGEELAAMAEALTSAYDQAEAANRAKSEFLAAMSHELRTPLNAILGFSELMASGALGPLGNPKYEEYTKDINDSGRHLLSLINDILDLSKVESGVQELVEDDIEVPKVTEAVLRLVRQRAKEREVELELELPDGLPLLRADKRALTQILANLLTNAIKFTDPGGKVTLRGWCKMDSGFVFQIADTGIGIAPEDIQKAFAQFGQIDSDLNRKYEGTGLGLPLTKALVELHGGSLDLQSEVGAGTTVTVRFPKERIVHLPEVAATGSPAV